MGSLALVCLQWPVQQNSLRWLAGKYLHETIQTGSHDSKVDAVTALRLVKVKLAPGPFFGKYTIADAQNLADVLHEQGRYVLIAEKRLSHKKRGVLFLVSCTYFWGTLHQDCQVFLSWKLLCRTWFLMRRLFGRLYAWVPSKHSPLMCHN